MKISKLGWAKKALILQNLDSWIDCCPGYIDKQINNSLYPPYDVGTEFI